MPVPKNVLEVAVDIIHDGDNLYQLDTYNNAIIADLERRGKMGSAKYGTPLQTHNGRNALLDLYEEMLDAYMYAVQYVVESEGDDSMDNIAVTVLNCLQSVANKIVSSKGLTGLLSHPGVIEPDSRSQIEQYANYKDAYRSLPPQQYQED